MENRFLNPTKPEEIVQELFNHNLEIVNEFYKYFSKEILEFAELFAAAYKKYLELDRLLIGTENKQKAYTEGFAYLIFDNLLVSEKLFILGYQTPSGNLMRQAIESVALAILCSSNNEIEIRTRKDKIKHINFFEEFVEGKSEAKSHKAIEYLEMNFKKLEVRKDAIDILKKSRSFFHQYSHPTLLSLATTVSFEAPGKMFIGGGFDFGKIKEYEKELKHRINFCRILPNIIEGLITKISKLP